MSFANINNNHLFNHLFHVFFPLELDLNPYVQSDFFVRESRDMVSVVQVLLKAGKSFRIAYFLSLCKIRYRLAFIGGFPLGQFLIINVADI